MGFNKIIITSSPVARYQKISVFKDGDFVEELEVNFDTLVDTTLALAEKYQITSIDLSGANVFTHKIANDLFQANATKYSVKNLVINQIGK